MAYNGLYNFGGTKKKPSAGPLSQGGYQPINTGMLGGGPLGGNALPPPPTLGPVPNSQPNQLPPVPVLPTAPPPVAGTPPPTPTPTAPPPLSGGLTPASAGNFGKDVYNSKWGAVDLQTGRFVNDPTGMDPQMLKRLHNIWGGQMSQMSPDEWNESKAFEAAKKKMMYAHWGIPLPAETDTTQKPWQVSGTNVTNPAAAYNKANPYVAPTGTALSVIKPTYTPPPLNTTTGHNTIYTRNGR